MTRSQKIAAAAKIASDQYGVTQRAARDLLAFWFDAGDAKSTDTVTRLGVNAGRYISSAAA